MNCSASLNAFSTEAAWTASRSWSEATSWSFLWIKQRVIRLGTRWSRKRLTLVSMNVSCIESVCKASCVNYYHQQWPRKRSTSSWLFPTKPLQTKRVRRCAIQWLHSPLIASTWSCSKFARQQSLTKRCPVAHLWRIMQFSAMLGEVWKRKIFALESAQNFEFWFTRSARNLVDLWLIRIQGNKNQARELVSF